MSEIKLKEMMKPVKKDAEDKSYLICIRGKDGESDSWDIVIGRTEAYKLIKNSIEFINLEESFILVETTPLSKRKSIYAFMKFAEQFYNDSFDIEDYVIGDYDDVSDNEYVLTMESILNNEIESTNINYEEE